MANVIGSAIESPNTPLMESGLDSLGAVDLRNSLAAKFAIELPATVTLDYPSISALAGYIASQRDSASPRKPKRGIRLRKHSASEDVSAIEIVGASCLYPGKIRLIEMLVLRYNFHLSW